MFRPRDAAGRFVFLHIPGVCFRRTRVQIRLDTDERKRRVPSSFSLLQNAPALHPGGNFLVSSMRVIVKIRAGAAELSLIISERLDPRIRLLLVIQFAQRKEIISGELILFRMKLSCFLRHLHVQYISPTISHGRNETY